MNTEFMLMAKYDAAPVIPLETVRKDYFPHMTLQVLMRRVKDGKFDLPVVNVGGGQKAHKGVALKHLAEYLDKQIETAKKLHERRAS